MMIHPNTQNMSQLFTPHSERLCKIFTALENILDRGSHAFVRNLNGGLYADPARREVLRCIRYVGSESEPSTMGVINRLKKAIAYINKVGRDVRKPEDLSCRYKGLTEDLGFLLERIEQAHKTNPTK